MKVYYVLFGDIKEYDIVRETPKGYRVTKDGWFKTVLQDGKLFSGWRQSEDKIYYISKCCLNKEDATHYALCQLEAMQYKHTEALNRINSKMQALRK